MIPERRTGVQHIEFAYAGTDTPALAARNHPPSHGVDDRAASSRSLMPGIFKRRPNKRNNNVENHRQRTQCHNSAARVAFTNLQQGITSRGNRSLSAVRRFGNPRP